MQLALYLHIPFCLKKCAYCAFNSRPLPAGSAGAQLVRRYLRALAEELRLAASFLGEVTLGSIYFGGGTPTLLEAPDLIQILEQSARYFTWSPAIEISLEANPGTVSRPKLQALRNAGVNRISIGAQSFTGGELQLLGRIHGVEEIYTAYRDARAAGFENINLDLIYGVPGQTAGTWRKNLEQALDLAPEHLSVYGLSLEEGTPLAEAVAAGELESCGEEEQVVLWEITAELLAAAGYERYEIANFARSGRMCRHNLVYWENLPYLGLGAGAHGFLGRIRYANHADVESYLDGVAQGKLPRAWEEDQPPEQERTDTIVMGLRLSRGLSLRAFRERFGVAFTEVYSSQLDHLVRAELIEVNDAAVVLTAKGRLLANSVLAHFI